MWLVMLLGVSERGCGSWVGRAHRTLLNSYLPRGEAASGRIRFLSRFRGGLHRVGLHRGGLHLGGGRLTSLAGCSVAGLLRDFWAGQ